MFVHLTVWPTLAWIEGGLKEMFCITTGTTAPEAAALAVVVAAAVGLAAELELELDELLELEPHPASATRISGNATADSRFMRWVSCSGSRASEPKDAGKGRKVPAACSASPD